MILKIKIFPIKNSCSLLCLLHEHISKIEEKSIFAIPCWKNQINMFSFQWYAYVLKECIFPYDHLSWFVLTAVSVNQVFSLHREDSNEQDDERDHLVSCGIEKDVRWSFVGKESKAVRGVTLWNPMIRNQLVLITKTRSLFWLVRPLWTDLSI